jgi:hypothetical protein
LGFFGFSKDDFNGLSDYIKDIRKKLKIYICAPHVRKNTTGPIRMDLKFVG